MRSIPADTPAEEQGRSRGAGRWPWLLLAAVVLGGPAVLAGGATPDSDPGVAEVPGRERLLDELRIPAWHAAGWRGQGVKVAVLDTGFAGYRSFLGAALPARVETRSFRSDGNLEARASRHGILCGEVIHTLAPQAELLLADWEPERPEQFLAAARWARRRGARVLTCSIIMPTWSDYEGHGPVHAALADLIGPGDRPGDALFFACAGNTAQRHWGGPFRDAGDGWHDWSDTPGWVVRDNSIYPWGPDRVSVELCFRGGAYELVVLDRTTGQEVGRSRGRLGERTVPHAAVAFLPHEDHSYAVRVRPLDPQHGPFHLAVLGGGLGYSRRRGSIPFPGDGPEVVAVGAVDASGHPWAYSACGPKEVGLKPDLVAPVPFPSRCRARPFSGTSAAAPQASALAALVWSRHPDWHAGQVRDALRRAARPADPSSHDWETGHGRIRLP
jgi:subtilisin family serine protease